MALIRWGTEPWQSTVKGVLANVTELARMAGLSAPVVAVIGKVADLRDKLRWYDKLPLFGKRILVTRTRDQASTLTVALAASGAFPIEVPTIEVKRMDDYSDLDGELRRLEEYEWVVFSS